MFYSLRYNMALTRFKLQRRYKIATANVLIKRTFRIVQNYIIAGLIGAYNVGVDIYDFFVR